MPSELEKQILGGTFDPQDKTPEGVQKIRAEVDALIKSIQGEFAIRREKMKQYKEVCKRYGKAGAKQFADATAKWKAWSAKRNADLNLCHQAVKRLKKITRANDSKYMLLRGIMLSHNWDRIWIENTDTGGNLWMASPSRERVIFIQEVSGEEAKAVLAELAEKDRAWRESKKAEAVQ